MNENPTGQSGTKQATNLYDAILQVFIEAIQRGVLPTLALFLGACLLWLGTLYLIPEAQRTDALREFLRGFKGLWWLGYGLAVVLALGWRWHYHWHKQQWELEMNRLAEQRNRWQATAFALQEPKARILSSTETPLNPALLDQFGPVGEE